MVKLQTMHKSHGLWGEIEDPARDRVNLTSSEKELLSRMPRPLALEGPRIHQPTNVASTRPKSENNLGPNVGCVTHGVQLLNYISELNKIKETAQNRRERGISIFSDLVIPPLPSLTAPNSIPVLRTPFKLNSTSPRHIRSSSNIGPITGAQSHKSLRKSVAALTAFHGYDQSTDQALDVLTDATGHFLSKLCNLMRAARDKELLSDSKCGFADIVCRAYDEMGCGSLLEIRSYYKNSIIGRHKAIGEVAEALAFECHHLDEVPALFSVENGVLDGDPDNIPEIHFPSSEEGENGSSGPPTLSLDHNAPQIETGLQMLQSLEQYGSLDGGGGGMVTPPPPSAHSIGMAEECDQPMSHDSNAALLLATVSPGSSSMMGNGRKRRKTSDNRNSAF